MDHQKRAGLAILALIIFGTKFLAMFISFILMLKFWRRQKILEQEGDGKGDDTKTVVSLNLSLEGFPNISKITQKNITDELNTSFDSIDIKKIEGADWNGRMNNPEQVENSGCNISDLVLKDITEQIVQYRTSKCQQNVEQSSVDVSNLDISKCSDAN